MLTKRIAETGGEGANVEVPNVNITLEPLKEADRGELELLLVKPDVHSKGVGYAAWCAIEEASPNVDVWVLVTSCFETHNIHFT